MEHSPPGFAVRLAKYLDDVFRAGSEAGRAFHFLEFVRGVYKEVDMEYLERLYPDLEKHIKLKQKALMVRGRVDAFLGNLIIEFEQRLDVAKLEEARSQLKRYVAILWSQDTMVRTPYLTMAGDGDNFVVYRPRTRIAEGKTVLPEAVLLDEIDRIDLRRTKPGDAFTWIDRYVLYKTRQPATAESISKEFGLDGPAFREAVSLLREQWESVRETTLYDQWASFLRVVYGSSVESQDLFIRHTYLATLAKLLAYSTISGGALPVSDEQLAEILEGRIFSEKWGVHNFLEEDFFSWVARESTGFKAARMMLERLAAYELSKVDEDILKALYQGLVDPEKRHDLGEYYTPDWLAEYIIEDVLDKPTKSVLDPACGSGTFLAAVIRKKKSLLKSKLANDELLDHILENVQGVDVHPLAVILSRATYLLSVGTDLLASRRGPIAIPVYMANSIRPPEELVEASLGIETYRMKADGKILKIPRKLAEDQALTDVATELVKEYANEVAKGEKPDEKEFGRRLNGKAPAIALDSDVERLSGVLYETSTIMAELIRQKRDTVWAFILKNIYKPLFLRKRRFDIIMGNPPWISYRYIESTDYQAFLKRLIVEDYVLLPSARAELITQLEIATLFFLRCFQLYARDDGAIAFVMPFAIFVSDQHDAFRSGTFGPSVKITKLVNLEDVHPLFKVRACVVIGRKGQTSYPIPGVKVEGKLPNKNVRLATAKRFITFVERDFRLYRIGQRSFIETREFERVLKAIESGERSFYYGNFTQGATIVPRSLWFVDAVAQFTVGIDPTAPLLGTSTRAIERAKEEYRDVRIEGRVENQFLYLAVTGSEIVPFGHLDLPLCVLPIEPSNSGFRIVRSDEAGHRGFSHLKKWMQEAEAVWAHKRREKAQKVDLYEWLDWANKLTKQSSRTKFKVLYNAAGTYLVSCVLDNGPSSVSLDGIDLKVSGIVAEHKVYFYDTDDADEALYLCGFLNAPTIDKLIKPMQSKGLWGERDIEKKVLELPIPRFNPSHPFHLGLVNLARESQRRIRVKLPELSKGLTGMGRIRQLVKGELEPEIEQIDSLVKRILVEEGVSARGLEDFA